MYNEELLQAMTVLRSYPLPNISFHRCSRIEADLTPLLCGLTVVDAEASPATKVRPLCLSDRSGEALNGHDARARVTQRRGCVERAHLCSALCACI